MDASLLSGWDKLSQTLIGAPFLPPLLFAAHLLSLVGLYQHPVLSAHSRPRLNTLTLCFLIQPPPAVSEGRPPSLEPRSAASIHCFSTWFQGQSVDRGLTWHLFTSALGVQTALGVSGCSLLSFLSLHMRPGSPGSSSLLPPAPRASSPLSMLSNYSY